MKKSFARFFTGVGVGLVTYLILIMFNVLTSVAMFGAAFNALLIASFCFDDEPKKKG
jgi:phage shock protein PspC (stress-responsive transcriptional regulator)